MGWALRRMTQVRFHRYSWFVLAFTLFVVLGGAFVRASVSGDGCGTHWPTCHGELFPHEGRIATYIEYGHRLSTGLYLLAVLGLLIWAFRAFPKKHPARLGAVLTLAFTLAEAAIGAGLVLFRLVAQNDSVYRAVAMPAHLVVTFLLLASVALTIWWANGGERLLLRGHGPLAPALLVGIVATLALGISGAITALGDTLFPAQSIAEIGLYATGAHFLKQLKVYHPVIAIATGLYLMAIVGMCLRPGQPKQVQRLARATALIFALQMVCGFVNLALLAPIWMQLVHLLLADAFWISLVFLAAAVFAGELAIAKDEAQKGKDESPWAMGAPVVKATWKDYLALTKPRVISLLLFTTLTAMVIAAGVARAGVEVPGKLASPSFWLYVAVGIGLYMAAGSANAINMVLERDLDLRMGRTAKRPTLTRISPRNVVIFAAVLGVGSFVLLWGSANLLSALMAQAGLAFYVLIYTLLLKRRSWTNIVIGGAAGAFPPLVGWAAVTGDLGPLAWCLFGIIFLWTPVHFWALAILIKEDYARAGVPMLPVVRGERATVSQIWCYAVLTVAISAVPLLLPGPKGQQAFGLVYLCSAVLLNVLLLVRSAQLYRTPDHPHARSLFKYSMVYLALLFLAMAVDRAPWL